MSNRNCCKQCPWINNDSHSIKFRSYQDKMKKNLKIENHACHMIEKDVWGSTIEINSNNICIGSKQNQNL